MPSRGLSLPGSWWQKPEYLGKKIQQKEVKMAMLPILATSFLILVFTGGQYRHAVREGQLLDTTGPPSQLGNSAARVQRDAVRHSSASENTVSAFAGINAIAPGSTSPPAGMQFGRFMFIIPLLAVAGSLAAQQRAVPSSSGTFPTHGPLYGPAWRTVLVWRPAFFPRGARPDRGAFLHARGKTVLLCDVSNLELTDDNDFDSSSCHRRSDDAHSQEGGAGRPAPSSIPRFSVAP